MNKIKTAQPQNSFNSTEWSKGLWSKISNQDIEARTIPEQSHKEIRKVACLCWYLHPGIASEHIQSGSHVAKQNMSIVFL